ncbi:FimB/Mfa2 family fimbrial subunit [Phocaeicola sp. HCN-40430]
MYYRYTKQGLECFDDYIYRMHYYLFDGDGRFMRQMFPEQGNMKRVSLEGMTPGEYTLIALANLDDYDTPDRDAKNGLENFEFVMQDFFPGTNELDSGDPIYWGTSTFVIEEGASNCFVTEMANIHCILSVEFEWEGLPPYSNGYSFRLEGVSGEYSLNPEHSSMLGIQTFPKHIGEPKKARRMSELEDMKLNVSIYTLRYKEGRIPELRLWHEDRPVTKPIDLEYVFGLWGWNPDINPVQEYAVKIMLKLDGSMEVIPKADADVNDWNNGGTIGM